MEFISATVDPIVECFMVPVKKHLGYLFSSKKHIRNMDTRMKQLDATRVDVKKHMETNNISNREIPARVPSWLEEVEKIKEDAECILSNDFGRFDLKTRYQAGKGAFIITQEIERLIKENLEIIWSDLQKPIGKVSSKKEPTFASLNGNCQGNDFKSREKTFNGALGFLQQDHKTQVIALCGMGGVGKTTMMEQLKKTVEDKNMFDWIVKVVVGQQMNIFSIQQAISEYIGQPLTEKSKTAREDHLRVLFGKISQESKNKVLIILDDVWEMVEFKDIGLVSPLPPSFKFLLTSRYESICTQIAVEANLDIKVVRVDVMEELEAHNFFCRIAGVLEEYDPELNNIGGDIVRRCGFLPLAIKLLATTLKSQEKFVWRNTLGRLKKKDLDNNVQEIIDISYTYLKEEEDRAIFLLCGLFPDDFDIAIEDLTRYAWGLNLLNDVSTLGDARDRTKTCVRNLKDASLLIDSDLLGCVKMHDLVLAFVLAKVSKGDQPWIIKHGDISNWSEAERSETCKRISLTCLGMSEFPRDFKYPSLSFFRLMRGDKTLKFPEDFYDKMGNLEVIGYEKMQYPLLPRSLEFSTKLRTLCFDQCLLMFDCSPIGDLLSLEVLSFRHCSIRKLPSAIGNLKKLKLLDVTGCVNLHIDDGVFKNLVKLEELYMRPNGGRSVKFTDTNFKELAECSKNLYALEIELLEKNTQQRLQLKKLERFKISIGHSLYDFGEKTRHSFENTLKLVTNKDELLESGVNELFKKTEVLHLQVDGMNDLVQVIVESMRPPQHSFYNLRDLTLKSCAELRYVFTIPMASGLVKLERLLILNCPVMEVVVYSENGGAELIKFQNLKYLYLYDLPKLVGLSNTSNVIELPQLTELVIAGLPNFTTIYPKNSSSSSSSTSSDVSAIQSFLNKEVVIPKLEILRLERMEKLKSIWASCEMISEEVRSTSGCLLRVIKVIGCDSVVNDLFPTNPMPLLRRLETLEVDYCGSIEVLFNIDVRCVNVGEIVEEGSTGSCNSNLRSIKVWRSPKFIEVWRLKGIIPSVVAADDHMIISWFQAVERIDIDGCKRFRNLFTPVTVARFDLGALRILYLNGDNVEVVQRRSQEINDVSTEERLQANDNMTNVAFPFHLIPIFHHLQELWIFNLIDVEVLFEIDGATTCRDLAITQNYQQPSPLLPHLKSLTLWNMENMKYVWKYNWNNILFTQKKGESSFQNLTSIDVKSCKNIKYLFSSFMIRLLSNLETLTISKCDGIEEVISNRDDAIYNNTTYGASIHDHVMCSQVDVASGFSFQEVRKLAKLEILECWSMRVIFEIEGVNNNGGQSIHSALTIQRSANMTFLELPNLKILKISKCDLLEHLFTRSTLESLKQLTELTVEECKAMQVIVKEDGEHTGVNNNGGQSIHSTLTIQRSANMTFLELPNLKILKISKCDLLEHLFTRSTLESLKQLTELTIEKCKAMQVIVKEDGEHTPSKSASLPRLKSLTLADLPKIKGFFLGMSEFQWPLLDKVKIYGCPQMMVFTSSHSMTPQLKCIHTGLGKHSLECGLNFHFTNTSHETQFHSSSMCSSPHMIGLLQTPWSFSNLIEVDANAISIVKEDANSTKKLLRNRIIFPCYELPKLQNLEKLRIAWGYHASVRPSVEEIFEVVEERNDEDVNEKQSVVVFPNLKEVTLVHIKSLRHMWKTNPRVVMNFPNLTKVLINQCDLLGHVFTSCMVSSLMQLQELQISSCRNMEVIIKQANDDSDTKAKEVVVVFPCLKSIKLEWLPNLKGFCLGKEDFLLPSLDTLEIKECPQITVFTSGNSTTPELKVIDTTFGLCNAKEDPTSFIKTRQQEGLEF